MQSNTDYLNQLRDLYSAQQQIFRAFPRLSKGLNNPSAKHLIEVHLEEIRQHAQRLENIAFGMGTHPSGRFCTTTENLVQQAYGYLSKPSQLYERQLLEVVKRLGEYTLNRYEQLHTLALQTNQEKAGQLLENSLAEVRQYMQRLEQLEHPKN